MDTCQTCFYSQPWSEEHFKCHFCRATICFGRFTPRQQEEEVKQPEKKTTKRKVNCHDSYSHESSAMQLFLHKQRRV